MVLKKDSFLYKVAYGYANKPPERTSICRFFWRFWFSLLFVWPIAMPVTLCFLAVVIGVMYACGFLVARRCTLFMSSEKLENEYPAQQNEAFVAFKRWPTVLGMRVWPLTMLLVTLCVWLAWVFTPSVWAWTTSVSINGRYLVYGLGAFVVAFLWFVGAFSLVGDFLRAVKRKVCPIIEFK